MSQHSEAEDLFFEEIDPATKQIYAWIDESLSRGQDNVINRASSASQCERKLWYKKNGEPGEQMDARAIINFALGDLTEAVVVAFLKAACVGPDKLYSEVQFGESAGECKVQGRTFEIFKQKTLITKIVGMEIPGHADGFGKRNSDGKWELIEIKSAADFGFRDFLEKGPGDYINQSHCLMMSEDALALGIRTVRFLYLKKNTGHIASRSYEFDTDVASEVANKFIAANQEQIPERPYSPIAETFRSKPTGKIKLPWQCSYCPYTTTCWTNTEMELKSGKPVYYIKNKTEEIA